jgi:hypothetical protein
MRYCEVEWYFKSQFYPKWVIGSTCHLTVLFSNQNKLYETLSDHLLEKCRRAFEYIEGGTKNGFIALYQIKNVDYKLEPDFETNIPQPSITTMSIKQCQPHFQATTILT